jgi:hypothetical protein
MKIIPRKIKIYSLIISFIAVIAVIIQSSKFNVPKDTGDDNLKIIHSLNQKITILSPNQIDIVERITFESRSGNYYNKYIPKLYTWNDKELISKLEDLEVDSSSGTVIDYSTIETKNHFQIKIDIGEIKSKTLTLELKYKLNGTFISENENVNLQFLIKHVHSMEEYKILSLNSSINFKDISVEKINCFKGKEGVYETANCKLRENNNVFTVNYFNDLEYLGQGNEFLSVVYPDQVSLEKILEQNNTEYQKLLHRNIFDKSNIVKTIVFVIVLIFLKNTFYISRKDV